MEPANNNDDVLATPEDISKEFDKVYQIWTGYETEGGDKAQPLEKTIEQLKQIEKAIILHGIFSPNEDIDDLLTENLKYLFLPYMLGDSFGRISGGRDKNLKFSKIYLNEYLKLLRHYQILPKELERLWKNMDENPKYEITRDEKIASLKEMKALEAKVQNLEKYNDEKGAREIRLSMITICAHKAINQLRLVESEFEILEYKAKLEKDKGLKAAEENYKPPPMQVYHIPKLTAKPEEPMMMNNMKHICDSCSADFRANLRQEINKKVFQPGTSQPTMTLDEFAEKEMERMRKTEAANKVAQERAQKEEDEDSDREDVDERKTRKARDWDDWKDEHEKGAGNKLKNR